MDVDEIIKTFGSAKIPYDLWLGENTLAECIICHYICKLYGEMENHLDEAHGITYYAPGRVIIRGSRIPFINSLEDFYINLGKKEFYDYKKSKVISAHIHRNNVNLIEEIEFQSTGAWIPVKYQGNLLGR